LVIKKTSKRAIIILVLFSLLLITLNFSIDSESHSNDAVQNEPEIALQSSTRNGNSSYGNISMAFFYDPICISCKEAMVELEKINGTYTGNRQFWYNLKVLENRYDWIDFMDAYNVPGSIRTDTPFLFVGDYYFHHDGVSFENVSKVLDEYSGEYIPLWPEWQPKTTIHLAFFYSEAVEGAQNAVATVSRLNFTWNLDFELLVIHNFSYNVPDNVLLFEAYFEYFNISNLTEYKNPKDIYAGIFIGDGFFLNQDIIYNDLNKTIKKYLGQNVPLKEININLTGGDLCLVFFYSPTCGDCHKARKILEDMKGKYPVLNVKEYNIADTENRILQESYFEYYDVPKPKQGTLGVFIGDRYFVDPDKLEDDIENIIEEKLDGCPCPEVIANKDVVVDKFTEFTILTVMAAGLVDGVNPCAFATLIFFIMYLSMTGRTKKQVLAIGITYTLGIFITYFVLGLGLYAFIAKSSSEIEIVSKFLFPVMGFAAIFFGFYSIYDYTKAKTGRKEEMMLQLPTSAKKLIGKTIKQQVKLQYFALIAIVTGVLIALFEFLCTGQVYLPTIMVIVAEVPEYQTRGVLYLVLYNFMFVLPLIIIFGAVYFGMSAEQLQEVLDKNRAAIKLLFALLFFGLGLFLLWYSWVFIF
jgi:cytochrome c biogenesis protein CcdA